MVLSSLVGGALGGATVSIVLRATDRASGTIDGVSKKLGAFGAFAAGTAAVGVAALGTAFVGLGAGISGAVQEAARFEQTRVAFRTLIGDAQQAELFLKDLTNFAKTTPFEIQGVEDSAKRLLAFGISSNEVIDDLTSLGNIAAGVGTDKLPNLITAFGQVRAKTVLAGEELRQFTEAGVPLADVLAEVTGYDVSKIVDNTKDLGITFDQVREALTLLSGEGGRFENLMAEQAKTVGGQFSNLKDTISITARGIGEALLPTINQLFPLIQSAVGRIGEALTAFFSGDTFTQLKDVAIAVGKEFFDKMRGINFQQIKETVGRVFEFIVANKETIVEIAGKFASGLVSGANAAIKLVSKLVESGALQVMLDQFNLIATVVQKIGGFLETVVNLISKAIDKLQEFRGSRAFGVLSSLSPSGITGRVSSGLFNDFVMRPGSDPVSFSPSDTIIGVKNPSSLGGSSVIINIDTVQGLDADSVAEALQSRLNPMVRSL